MNETCELVRYGDLGLPNVVLKDITIKKCPECGHSLMLIPDLDGLSRYVVECLINKPERLSRPEISFLRKSLGWSKADCARNLHVWPEQVSRWESDVTPVPMQVQSELLLRAIVALIKQVEGFSNHLEEIATVNSAQTPLLSIHHGHKGWETVLKKDAGIV